MFLAFNGLCGHCALPREPQRSADSNHAKVTFAAPHSNRLGGLWVSSISLSFPSYIRNGWLFSRQPCCQYSDVKAYQDRTCIKRRSCTTSTTTLSVSSLGFLDKKTKQKCILGDISVLHSPTPSYKTCRTGDDFNWYAY